MLKIKHQALGRIRYKYSELKRNKLLVQPIYDKLIHINGVTKVRINVHCGSVIIQYESESIRQSEFIRAITSAEALQPLEITVDDAVCSCTSVKQKNIKSKAVEFSILSSIMGSTFITSKFTSFVVRQTVFSPLGLVAIAFSIPLLVKSVREIKEQKKITLSSFLSAGILSSVFVGEALTALEILWINSGSELMSSYVAEKSRKAIGDILEVTAKTTFILLDGIELEVLVEELKTGDTVVVHTGEKISVDGAVIDGEAMVNEAPLSGRSDLIHKKTDDKVYAGTYVQEGLIYIRAEQVGDKTYLTRMLHLVEDSLENKAPIELEADRLAQRLVRLGFILTGGTLLLTGSLYRAFSVLLLMACPCATVLSASSAVNAALNNAASRGILIKGGRYLEEAGSQESFCFDKTGTLTTGDPIITDIVPLKGFTEIDVITSAYVAELHNRHPLASAIRAKAEKMELPYPRHAMCDTILGKGVRAEFEGSTFLIGSRKLMQQYKISTRVIGRYANSLSKEGKSIIYVVKNDQMLGVIAFENELKECVIPVITQLRAEGVKELILITGDEASSAEPLAKVLQFDKCYSSILPEDKAKIVEKIQKDHKVTMIGDGINDVLALVKSDLGIAMGAIGSDVAIEAADIALVDDDLEKILHLRQLSRKTKEVIQQNFLIATSTNLGGAFFGFFGLLTPVMAGMIHVVHTTFVMMNSSRLLKYEEAIKIGEGDVIDA